MPEVTSNTLSDAWIRALFLARNSTGGEVRNLIVSIENFSSMDSLENESIRTSLDEGLEAADKYTVATVANTIFPASLWTIDQTRDQFYERYLRLWPRISVVQANRRGTYFQRLISFPSPNPANAAFNQLEHVISAFKKGVKRRSTFQCSILAPWLDLNATPYQGFPCMQQVAFMPEGGRLRISALYPMHYLCARGYGNYLGLLRLGDFVAGQMGLPFLGLTCVSLVACVDMVPLARSILEKHHEI